MSFFKKFHFTSLLKPMIYVFLFSIVYTAGYFFMMQSTLPLALSITLEVLWVSLFGLGLYFAAGLAWGQKRKTLALDRVLMVLAWNVCWSAFASVIPWLVGLFFNPVIYWLWQAASLVLLIFLMPATFEYYYALYEGMESLRNILRSIWTSLIHNFSKTVNPWLVLLLLIIGWSTLFAGPLSIAQGANAGMLISSLLYLGSPCSYWVLLAFLNMGGEGVAALIVLEVLISILFTWLEVNLIAWNKESFEKAPSGGAESKA